MSEYIERETVLKHKHIMCGSNWGGDYSAEAVLVEDIGKIPAADVAPVVHGKWIEAKLNGMSLYPVGQKMCNICGQIMPSQWETMPPFCYGCGAKMDAKSEVEK